MKREGVRRKKDRWYVGGTTDIGWEKRIERDG